MSAEFTPGPWDRWDQVAGYNRVTALGTKCEHIATVQGEENARLIAAAPELYAALITARQMLVEQMVAAGGHSLPPAYYEDHPNLRKMDAVLAKAGEA